MSVTKLGYQRILVATDFSAHAEAALEQAVWIARRSGATITLAHTLPDLREAVHGTSFEARMDLLYGEGTQFQKEIRQTADARMKRMIADLGASDITVKYETLLGRPFVELIHAVQAEGYDLVITGSRGLGALESALIGSTAKRLIRKCPSTVWTVRDDHVRPPKVVLAATDFSDVSIKAVKEGYWIAEQANAQFHLVHVIESSLFSPIEASNDPALSLLRHDMTEDARQRLQALRNSLLKNADEIELHLSWGTPWKVVKQAATDLKVDLLAIGTVGRSGIRSVLMGNTAEKVLTVCDCSILTVKSDDFVSPIQPASWPLHP